MTPKRFLDQFGHLADAPNGIAKLRELILQLAVRGKLVAQDPNDEPAGVLLERIREEKERLVGEGKIKKTKALRAIDPAGLEFELPEGWNWNRLGEIATIERGGSPRPIKDYLTDDPEGLNWIKIGDSDIGGKYITSAKEKIRRDGLSKTRMVYPGDFLLTNSMSFGRPYITRIEGCIHDGWLRISPPDSLVKDYLYTLLSSAFARAFFTQSAAGAVVMNLNSDKVRELAIPFPPLAEQSRIVAKVDQLMALCDELEAKQNQRAETQVQLIHAAHQPLIQPSDQAELQAAWRRIRDNFDDLHTTVDSVKVLRQTILQLAMQGKLVPQDPNDEPASVLLERIRAEKERLVAEGKIKGTKPQQPIDPVKMPFALPQTWKWARLESLLVFGPRNGYSPRPVEYATDVKTLTLTAITSGTFDRDQYKFLDVEIDPDSHLWLEDGDILIQRANTIDYVGTSAIYIGSKHEYVYPDLIMKIRASPRIDDDFLHLALLSSGARNHMRERATGTSGSMPKVNQKTVSSIPVPVAPLEHQRKVVSKVNQLMALCDELEAKIGANETTSRQFAEAIVAKLAA